MAGSVSQGPVECDIVALAAHPDDAELCCGGTLALAAGQGWKAGVVDFTRGELSTRGTVEERAREAEEAAAVLGLACRVNLGLPDGHVADDGATRALLVETLRVMRPQVVLCPPVEDHHADHIAVAEVARRSLYLCGVAKYGRGGSPWRPRALLHWVGTRPAIPQLVVDVSEVFEKRKRAILCYRSQFHDPESTEPETRISHPDFLAWVEGGLRRAGFLIGVPYGEAFTSPEPVPVTDLIEQFGRTR